MHLGGFVIRIYHDARSPERQKSIFGLSLDIQKYKIKISINIILPIILYGLETLSFQLRKLCRLRHFERRCRRRSLDLRSSK